MDQRMELLDYERLGLEIIAAPNHRSNKRKKIEGVAARLADGNEKSQDGGFITDGLTLPNPESFG